MLWKLTDKEVTYNYLSKYLKKNKQGWRLPTIEELKSYIESIPKNNITKYWVNGTKPHSEFLVSFYDFNIDSVVYTNKDRKYFVYLCKDI